MSDEQNRSNADGLNTIIGLVLFLGMIAVGFWFLWGKYDHYIKEATYNAALVLRYIQFPLTPVFFDSYATVILNLDQLALSMSPAEMPNDVFLSVLKICFRSSAIALLCFLLPFAIFKIKNSEKMLFERKLSLDDLITLKREVHPRIKPATAKNLIEIDPRFGPWATQQNPIDLVLDANLITIESDLSSLSEEQQTQFAEKIERLGLAGMKGLKSYQPSDYKMTHTSFKGLKHPTNFAQSETAEMIKLHDNIDQYIGLLSVDREAIQSYYTESLGERCRYNGRTIDINYLPPSERAIWMLLTVCVAGRGKDRDEIDNILDRMSDSFQEGTHRPVVPDHQIDFTGLYELYNDVINEVKVKLALVDISKQHAYYYTAFTRLFMKAKSVDGHGTIIARDFHWLKTVNRQLYFVLNQVGLETTRPETAGVRAHFRAEEKLAAKITSPVTESAALNLVNDLFKEGYLMKPLTEEDKYGVAHWHGEVPSDDEVE